MSNDILQQQEEVNRKISEAYERLEKIQNNEGSDSETFKQLTIKRQRFAVLSDISEQLEKLEKLGGENLFWGDDYDPQQVKAQQQRIHNLIVNYDTDVDELRDLQHDRDQEREILLAQINVLNAESLSLQEREDAFMDEFVIEREMTAIPYHEISMPWNYNGDDERQFRKVLLIVLLVSIVLGVLIPLWKIPLPDRIEPVAVPQRLAQLIIKQTPPPPQPKKAEPKKEKKPEKKLHKKSPEKDKKSASPKPDKTKIAHRKVQHSGLLAFKDDFADLIDDKADKKLGSTARLAKGKGRKSRRTTRSLVTADAGSSSGGINTASLSRNVGNGGDSMGGVKFSHVKSSIGTDFAGEERPLSDGPGPSRTDEEIQIVFDRYKAALYRIYNRELRKNPTLQGKMVLKLTIQPNGKVSFCKVDSSDMDAPELNRKIAARVKRFNFGAKAGVPAITILYPIDFLPAS